MSQVIDRELEHYMGLLNARQKKSILAVIKTFLSPTETVGRVSRSQYNKELDEAENRINSGDYLTQEELENDASTW